MLDKKVTYFGKFSYLNSSCIRMKYYCYIFLVLREINSRFCSKTQARFKRRSIHAPNLTDELSTAEERRLNQFGSAD